MQEETLEQRILWHLRDMKDGVGYTFFDHELLKVMREKNFIYRSGNGNWSISKIGREAAVSGIV